MGIEPAEETVSNKLSSVTSVISIPVTSDKDKAVYKCEASNPKLSVAATTSAQVELNVICKFDNKK